MPLTSTVLPLMPRRLKAQRYFELGIQNADFPSIAKSFALVSITRTRIVTSEKLWSLTRVRTYAVLTLFSQRSITHNIFCGPQGCPDDVSIDKSFSNLPSYSSTFGNNKLNITQLCFSIKGYRCVNLDLDSRGWGPITKKEIVSS